MLKSVEGIYRNGRIELTEAPPDVGDDTRVIVTFLSADTADLRANGIDPQEAVDLRGALSTFAADWDSAEMAVYDDYEKSRQRLSPR
jgi:hypothetical protein